MTVPMSDEGPTVGAVALQENIGNQLLDCQAASPTYQVALLFEVESCSQGWLRRLHAGAALRGDIALIAGFWVGEMLQGACRVLKQAIGGAA